MILDDSPSNHLLFAKGYHPESLPARGDDFGNDSSSSLVLGRFLDTRVAPNNFDRRRRAAVIASAAAAFGGAPIFIQMSAARRRAKIIIIIIL